MHLLWLEDSESEHRAAPSLLGAACFVRACVQVRSSVISPPWGARRGWGWGLVILPLPFPEWENAIFWDVSLAHCC